MNYLHDILINNDYMSQIRPALFNIIAYSSFKSEFDMEGVML